MSTQGHVQPINSWTGFLLLIHVTLAHRSATQMKKGPGREWKGSGLIILQSRPQAECKCKEKKKANMVPLTAKTQCLAGKHLSYIPTPSRGVFRFLTHWSWHIFYLKSSDTFGVRTSSIPRQPWGIQGGKKTKNIKLRLRLDPAVQIHPRAHRLHSF